MRRLLIILLAAALLVGCSPQQMAEELGGVLGEGADALATANAQDPAAEVEATLLAEPTADQTTDDGPQTTAEPPPATLYLDPSAPIPDRVADLLGRMTLDEKIAQMTQVEKNSISPDVVAELGIGSVLSGGGGYPRPNTPAAWLDMVAAFDAAARDSRLGIPLIYGMDAIHGAGAVDGATLFPQPIGLAATGDADLVRQTARITAIESAALGVRWNFAPVLAVVQDVRWGRTYESFGDDTALVAELGAAYVRGLQQADDGQQSAEASPLADPTTMLATPKHFIGDGATVFGSSTQNIMDTPYLLDQGDMTLDEAAIRERLLPPYAAALDAGALSVMATFNSWQGEKVHGRADLLTGLLKEEMGFRGFVVSDWGGCDQIDRDYYTAIVRCINAGVDMNMVPQDYNNFMDTMRQAVANGDVSQARIDDAVGRILTVKFEMGLFEAAPPDPAGVAVVGAAEHRAVAREAVRRSLVLLQNNNAALPIPRQGTILVAGPAADDAGTQAGGWTIDWQGVPGGTITGATTLLDGIRAAAGPAEVVYNAAGRIDGDEMAATGVVVLAEPPYAEGVGDSAGLALSDVEIGLIERVAERSQRTVVVLLSGRPLIITEALPLADAWVAAWLPGSEGAGVADVLFGDSPFTGRLPVNWPRSVDQLPLDALLADPAGALFPRGFGLEE